MASLIDTLISKCASWDKFVLLANNQRDNKFKGDLFERLTQIFLKTSSTYATKLENVWWCNNNELPEKIRKKLRLPSTDEGIDLICKTVEGEFWSVQCKYKADQSKPLNHKELSTFTSLSFNAAENITLGLVVHTSTKKVRKSDLMANVTEVGLEKWLEISKEDWKRIRIFCRSNKLLPPKQRKPRKHQKAAIKDAVQHFSKRSVTRGKLIMPCATGKSLTAFWIAQALESKSIVVAVPSLALIRQSLGDWTAEFLAHGVKPEWIAVCSDSTVGNTADAESTVASVYETGIPTTTDQATIQKFLRRQSEFPKIIFTTYQSGQKLCEATKDWAGYFDLLICDEAHKTVGVSDKAFASLLFDENIKVKRRIFMTATERIYRQKKDDVVSMDDPKIYGEVFHELSFKEAIKQKIICDYKILTIAVTADEAKALIENNELLRVADGKESFKTDAHNLSVGLTVKKVFEKYKIKHAVSFHSSIKRAKFFSEQQGRLPAKHEIKNYHISSKHSAGERARMLKQFENDDFSLIANARCLTEGVDIPAIDCVVFSDPKHSTVDIVQAAGRAMRQSKTTDKQFGYIVVPLVIPENREFSNFADTTNFADVASIITSLSTSDKRIAEQIKLWSKRKKIIPTDIIQFDTEILQQTGLNLEDFNQALSTRIWSRVGKANYLSFDQAKAEIHKLGLNSEAEFRQLNRNGLKPVDIPTAPDTVYKNVGWNGWPDFLGYEGRQLEYRNFEAAREFARTLKLKSRGEWLAYAKTQGLPKDVPLSFWQTYKNDGFKSVADFLGSDYIAPSDRNYWSFEKARSFTRGLKLKNQKEWTAFLKSDQRPKELTGDPAKTYQSEYKGLHDWLGTDYVATKNRSYLSLLEAKEFVARLGLKTHRQWMEYCKSGDKPDEIPAGAQRVYKDDGWISWQDFLGTGRLTNAQLSKAFWDYNEAKAFVSKFNFKTSSEYREYWKANTKPATLPVNPNSAYQGKGWISWSEFIGYNSRKKRKT